MEFEGFFELFSNDRSEKKANCLKLLIRMLLQRNSKFNIN